ncbi:MAG: hypothetical protein U0640_08805 [Phycisphaerales bacterium]
MDIAVSPYHLTTREAAAMAALLLGRRVLTMLPAPVEASAQATKTTGKTTGGIGGMSALQTAATIPTYRRFVESWAWTVPLWEQGVLHYSREGETFVNDMWAVTQHIDEDDTCIALRHFTKRHDYPDDGAYLSAVAADMLKGGPDPGISLPVAAALDRFATRHGLTVARTNGTRNASRAQQAEATLAAPLATFSMPMLMQASSGRILHWREVLAKELTPLSLALRRLSEQVAVMSAASGAINPSILTRDVNALQAAAETFSRAVATRHEELLMGSIDDEVKPIEALATISCVPLPWDAVLKSSVRAISSLGGSAQTEQRSETTSEPASTQAISKYDSVRGKSFLALVVKIVGK